MTTITETIPQSTLTLSGPPIISRTLTDAAYFYQRSQPCQPRLAKSANGIFIELENGQRILDASCGAAVSSVGHGHPKVKKAIIEQLEQVVYCHTGYYETEAAQELATLLVDSTKGKMSRAIFAGSGSEGVETGLKLARQYFLELSPPQPRRQHFISRYGSWHGCTLGALAIGDIKSRKGMFEPMLNVNTSKVPPCHPYRELEEGETTEQYVLVSRKTCEDEFQRVGPDTVCAFVAEPIVGSALGCVPAVAGYFKAMKEVCDRHGALLVFDEVMCGLGRSGTFHAWEQEDVVPDVCIVGKGLGAGYVPISAVLTTDRVVSVFQKSGSLFCHGQTYQCHPLGCAAALAVQRVIRDENLVDNVRELGVHLEKLLKERLGNHPHVGDIRGRGFFWAIEFVQDKATKMPFEPSLKVAARINEKGLKKGYDVSVFKATGSANGGYAGDHIMIMPPFIVTKKDVEEIVNRVTRVVEEFFTELKF